MNEDFNNIVCRRISVTINYGLSYPADHCHVHRQHEALEMQLDFRCCHSALIYDDSLGRPLTVDGLWSLQLYTFVL